MLQKLLDHVPCLIHPEFVGFIVIIPGEGEQENDYNPFLR